MTEFKRIAIDTSKAVFTLHGVDQAEHVVLRRDLRRHQVEPFFARLPATQVVLEATGGSYHWARRLAVYGHQVRLIAPQYVKPFVKRGKNDRNDAEAISDAASRPDMRFVPLKSADQQAGAMVMRVRELLVRQRTQLINALRGHVGPRGPPDAAEFGVIAAKSTGSIPRLLTAVADDADMPDVAKEMLAYLGQEVDRIDDQVAALDKRLLAEHRANPLSRLLAGIPGIGPIGALTLVQQIDASQFRSGRHFAAWAGLTPKERSTGGKQRMGGISRAGNERLRQLLVLGATAVVKVAKPGGRLASAWLMALLERRPRKLVAVALANKMARIVPPVAPPPAASQSDRREAMAMMTSGEAYRRQPMAA